MIRYGYLAIFLLFGILFAGTMASSAQQPADSLGMNVDGHVWMKSTDQEKYSFLLGAMNAVVLEYHVREKASEAPSRFVKVWIAAFKDTNCSELSTKIDNYYSNNPEKMDRHVFEVIGQEVIAPDWKS